MPRRKKNARTKQQSPMLVASNIWNITSVDPTMCMTYCSYVNLEHSSFPIICKNVHLAMGKRFSNDIPFAMFLHVMTGYLNANLIVILHKNRTHVGGKYIKGMEYYQGISEIEVPKPICDYVASIGQIKLNSGETIYHNLPEIAIPDDGSKFEAGTFGPITESTHNVYECYISPYVTKQLIKETIKANAEKHFKQGISDNEKTENAWNPLPPGYIPQNAVATEYLLGYLMPEELSHEALAVLQHLMQIPTDDGRRLCLSNEMILKFNRAVSHMNNKKSVLPSDAGEVATLGFLRINETVDKGHLVERAPAELFSPVPLSRQDAAKALMFGMRCERTSDASRSCLLVNGDEPSGWNETRNDNFLCKGEFSSSGKKPSQSLFEPRHRGCFNITRRRLIRNFAQESLNFGQNNFDGVYESIPHFHALCVNLDHSTFVIICQDVYRCTSYRFRKRFPYALFLHIMTCYLYANLLMRDSENCCSNIVTRDDYFRLINEIESVPTPIYEYVAAIGRIKLDSGEIIYHNLPKIAIPDDGSDFEAGTFGRVNESTHNVYECYISPYVTKQFIMETIKANDNGTTGAPWNPLPEDYVPQNAVATEHLLGYSTTQKLAKEALFNLKKVAFSSATGVEARLCWPEYSSVPYALNLMVEYETRPAEIECKNTNDISTLGFLRVHDRSGFELCSPVHLNKENAAKAVFLGMRRDRTTAGSESCYKINGSDPSGWNKTCNDNFLCKGDFSPTDGKFLGSFNDDKEIGWSGYHSFRFSFVQKFEKPNQDYSSSDSD